MSSFFADRKTVRVFMYTVRKEKQMIYGFIGVGNMASAILRGMARSGRFPQGALCGYNRTPAKALALQEEMGLTVCESERKAAERADAVVLAVKPQMLEGVLEMIASVISPDKLVVTIAAGKETGWYEERLGPVPVARVMPNINARVGLSVSALCGGRYATPEHLQIAREMFETVGAVYDVEERLFSAFSAIGGASAAFVHLYIDALASAGVQAGLPRPLSEEIACRVVEGSARLTAQSTEHPIALMDQVCSPGGTTIEGVHTLKRLGFETAVQQAVRAVIEKDKQLGK